MSYSDIYKRAFGDSILLKDASEAEGVFADFNSALGAEKETLFKLAEELPESIFSFDKMRAEFVLYYEERVGSAPFRISGNEFIRKLLSKYWVYIVGLKGTKKGIEVFFALFGFQEVTVTEISQPGGTFDLGETFDSERTFDTDDNCCVDVEILVVGELRSEIDSDKIPTDYFEKAVKLLLPAHCNLTTLTIEPPLLLLPGAEMLYSSSNFLGEGDYPAGEATNQLWRDRAFNVENNTITLPTGAFTILDGYLNLGFWSPGVEQTGTILNNLTLLTPSVGEGFIVVFRIDPVNFPVQAADERFRIKFTGPSNNRIEFVLKPATFGGVPNGDVYLEGYIETTNFSSTTVRNYQRDSVILFRCDVIDSSGVKLRCRFFNYNSETEAFEAMSLVGAGTNLIGSPLTIGNNFIVENSTGATALLKGFGLWPFLPTEEEENKIGKAFATLF